MHIVQILWGDSTPRQSQSGSTMLMMHLLQVDSKSCGDDDGDTEDDGCCKTTSASSDTPGLSSSCMAFFCYKMHT